MKGISEKAEESLQKMIRKMRVDADVTQAELANRLNTPQSFISKFESGERRLDILELRVICKALGTNLNEFVRRLEREIP